MAATPKSTHTVARQWISVQHGAFRFEHAHGRRAHPRDRADAVRLLHRSPLAEMSSESARGVRGDRHQHSSRRRCQAISRMNSSRGLKIERWTQMAFLGVLEFYNDVHSENILAFRSLWRYKITSVPPTHTRRRDALRTTVAQHPPPPHRGFFENKIRWFGRCTIHLRNLSVMLYVRPTFLTVLTVTRHTYIHTRTCSRT